MTREYFDDIDFDVKLTELKISYADLVGKKKAKLRDEVFYQLRSRAWDVRSKGYDKTLNYFDLLARMRFIVALSWNAVDSQQQGNEVSTMTPRFFQWALSSLGTKMSRQKVREGYQI